MKRKIALIIILNILFAMMFLNTAGAANLDLDVKSAVLIDASSGKVLYDLNAEEKRYPASMTKIMTLIVAIEAVEQGKVKLTDTVTTSEHAASFGGSQVWLEPGENFTLEELLVAVAVGSANDASVAVAEFIGGTEGNFLEMMNNKAKEIGAKNTNFVNPHGLHDDNHYTTAQDMALMARYAVKQPELMRIAAIKYYKFREEPLLELWNLNKLLWWYQGADGLKTGTTSHAGRNLTATAKRDGLRLIAVVMGVEERNGHFKNAMNLLNFGFNSFSFKSVFQAGDKVSSVAVSKGTADTVNAVAAEDVGFLTEKGSNPELETKIDLPDWVKTPIKEGDKVGEVILYEKGKEVSRVDLIAEQGVEKAGFFKILKKSFVRMLAQ